MRIIDRHIGKAVIGGSLLALGVLLALFSFISFIGEQDTIGRANYGVAEALLYVFLMTPRIAYQLMPLAALLGSLVGLGVLASQNELIVLRAAGVSVQRIVIAVMKAGLVLVLLSVILSEYVIAESEKLAMDMRARALNSNVTYRSGDGFWTRNENSFIKVHTVLSDGRMAGVHIYDFGSDQHLIRITQARQARFEKDSWQLTDVIFTEFKDDRVLSRRVKSINWQTLLDPQMVEVVAVKPQSLSTGGLYHYIQYLTGNGLDAARYEMELWVKLVLPLATGVMVFLAIPFVFGSLRAVGIGQRIMMGTMLGISFYLLNQISTYVSLAYHFNPVASAILPTFLFFLLGVYLMRRMA